jgi:phage head maturation protease
VTDVIRKAMAQIEPGADDGTSEHGTFRVILSDDTFDRDGESLKSGEWITPLPEHITFDIDHSMNVAGTVGSGKPSIGTDGKMYVDGTYSSRPLAQEVRGLVNEGHIRTTSVAFLRRKDAKAGTTKRELLNGAFVAVPANPNAVILASKAFEPDHDDADTKAGARNSSADAKRLQQMHDLAVENGAACNCDAPDGKSFAAALRVVEQAAREGADALQALKATTDALTAASVDEPVDAEASEPEEPAAAPDEEPESDEKAVDEDDLYVKAQTLVLRAAAAL